MTPQLLVGLSPKSTNILNLTIQGLESKSIAEMLHCTNRTVKAHLNKIYQKMGYSNTRLKRCMLIRECTSIDRGDKPSQANLSRKEWLIVELVARGYKNKDIAIQIGHTECTIKNYLRVIYDNIGAWTRGELIVWYYSHRFHKSC